jgi:hypothetical protein
MPKIVWMNFARRYRIALGNPADLIFADGMHRLVAFHPSACTLDRAESEPRGDPLFDEPMVLLDDVVQVRRRSAATAATWFTALLPPGDRAGVCRMSTRRE